MEYTNMALESLLCENIIFRNMTLNRMLAESEFIVMSMENGIIQEFVQEASLKEHAKKIIELLKQFIDKIVGLFRKKTVEKYKKYIDWVDEKSSDIKKKAETGSITMSPYWNGSQETGENKLKTLIKDAFKYPYEEDDISFATKILPNIKDKKDLDDTGKISNMLKNQFRFGKDQADNKNISRETLEKESLVSKVGDMIDYVVGYDKISQGLTSITNSWETQSQNFQTAISESMGILTKNMPLVVENTILSRSDLILVDGFGSIPECVFEAENQNSDSTSLTTVENNNDGGDNNESKNNKSSNGNSRYALVDKFTRLAFSAYLTACEERFIVYIKCISQILGESPKSNKNK